jgi:hypothetical protein
MLFDEKTIELASRLTLAAERDPMGDLITRKAILEADDIETRRVHVPEWGGDVLVRSMTGAERDAFEATIVQKRGKDYQVNMHNIRAKLAAWTIVDEKGEHLFSEVDVEALSKKSAGALQRIFNVSQELSGITAGDVEELAKNLRPGQSDGSGSA